MAPELVTKAEASQSKGAQPEGWWRRYETGLEQLGLSPTAKEVIHRDAAYITERGVLGAGRPGEVGSEWPESRLRRGLVMGSVQSGKTASLLGVSALALDAGIDILVVLAGTRIALFRQTYSRVLDQLDRWSSADALHRNRDRILLPDPSRFRPEAGGLPPEQQYRVHPRRVRRYLSDGKPLIAVVMKQVDHLNHFGQFLRSVTEDGHEYRDRPLHMLVVDDEADDGSILDEAVERGLDPASARLKQIPRYIARLWASPGDHGSTRGDWLYATYLAYTATPQANFLQSSHNPLSPSEFVCALRNPFTHGPTGEQREPTYLEPLGIRKFYCGGKVFYTGSAAQGMDLTVVPSGEPPDDVELDQLDAWQPVVLDAVKAYLVASAIRLSTDGRSLGDLFSRSWSDIESLEEASPPPELYARPYIRLNCHTL